MPSDDQSKMKKIAEKAAKAISFPPNFKENDCEDLRVEDFSSDDDEPEGDSNHICVSIGEANTVRDKANFNRDRAQFTPFGVAMGQKQSLLSSLVSNSGNYDMPVGISVSFSADKHEHDDDMPRQTTSRKNSLSELVEF